MATCPRCGSSVRRGSDWCTLCFADLRPVPPPRVSPDPMLVPPPPSPALAAALTGTTALAEDAPDPAPDPASAGGRAVAIACSSCGEPVALDVAVCGTCGAGLFDKLKEDATSLTLPGVGDVMRFGKGARAGLAAGFAVLFIVVLFTLITLLGHVF